MRIIGGGIGAVERVFPSILYLNEFFLFSVIVALEKVKLVVDIC